jgi:hypothetical protein
MKNRKAWNLAGINLVGVNLVGIMSVLAGITLFSQIALADSVVEESMNQDDLTTVFGLPWAASDWDFSRVIEVQRSSIDSTVVGRVVLDRHGIDDSEDFIRNPFSAFINTPFAAPLPGRIVLISSWGSLDEGCYAELFFQVASGANQGDASRIIPTQVEMNINGQIITLQAQSDRAARYSDPIPFNYTDYVLQNGESVPIPSNGTWYAARHLFQVDANTAQILSNAPDEDIDVRVVLRSGQPITYEIGDGTVRRWRDVFSYNPSCRPGGANPGTTPSPAPSPSTPPSSAPTPGATPTPAPVSPPANQEPVLIASQNLDEVTIRLEGVRVRPESFIADLLIENRSDRQFGFVPLFARVEDAEGNTVRSRILFGGGGDVLVEPGGQSEGELYILDRPWNESGDQNLFLVIREGTTGGRTFRIAF